MGWEAVLDALPKHLRAAHTEDITEIRLRAGQKTEICGIQYRKQTGDILSEEALREIVTALLERSVYAREDELRQGYFSVAGGCRVGVAGRYAVQDGKIQALTRIQSICIRVPREIIGCADEIAQMCIAQDEVRSALIVSKPGMGKTTCLRDLARSVSMAGWHVGLVDERGELAATQGAMPTLDVGMCTDVVSGCPKALAIPRLIRSMSPDVIAVDELGGAGDEKAVMEAMRCGVSILATMHGNTIQELRGGMRDVFPIQVLLGESVGKIARICRSDVCKESC